MYHSSKLIQIRRLLALADGRILGQNARVRWHVVGQIQRLVDGKVDRSLDLVRARSEGKALEVHEKDLSTS